MAPKTRPATSASGGEAHGVRQNTRPATNNIFDRMNDRLDGQTVFNFTGRVVGADGLTEGENKMGLMPKSGDDSLAPDPFDPEADRR